MLFKDNIDWNPSASFWSPEFNNTEKSSVAKVGAGGVGMLMWQAREAGKNEFVLVQDMVTGGLGNGAFTSRYTTKEINENFTEITRTFGANPI